MTCEQHLKNLKVPMGKIDVIFDTDTFNEIDDQFALSYLLLSEDKANTVGICAAPFFNKNSSSPAEGMEKSYLEILKILKLLNRSELESKVYRGSPAFLSDEKTPIVSDAAKFIASTAEKYSPENPLYVVAVGAITNVASAILLAPEAMRENTVIVWLGGHGFEMPDTKEFNLFQDVAAARIVFDSKAPLVLLPCRGVVSALTTTKPELYHWIHGVNPLGTYLAENTAREAESYASGTAWSRCIWDVSAVAWLLNENDRFLSSYEVPTPFVEYSGHYSFDKRRHPMTYVFQVNRDAIFTDLFNKIRNAKL